MATEQVRTTKTETEDFFGGMWETGLNMQRQAFSFWTRPLGFTPSVEGMWKQMETINTQWLNLARRTNELTGTLVDDQVKLARDLSDKTLKMTRGLSEREPRDMSPDLAKHFFDATRRSAERFFAFGNDTMKAVEEFGLRTTETLTQVPVAAK